jgi:hypothetical protein
MYKLLSAFPLFLILISIPPVVQSQINISAGLNIRDISGEVDLKPGWGGQFSISMPFSKILELEGIFNLPTGLRVNYPSGQVFSAGNYYKAYQTLSYTSLSAGMLLNIVIKQEQKIIPCLRLHFGRTWLSGSSKDGFTGYHTDFGAGIKYRFNAKWQTDLSYLYSDLGFNSIKINGDRNELKPEPEVSSWRIMLAVCYLLSWNF